MANPANSMLILTLVMTLDNGMTAYASFAYTHDSEHWVVDLLACHKSWFKR